MRKKDKRDYLLIWIGWDWLGLVGIGWDWDWISEDKKPLGTQSVS